MHIASTSKLRLLELGLGLRGIPGIQLLGTSVSSAGVKELAEPALGEADLGRPPAQGLALGTADLLTSAVLGSHH